MEPSSSERAAFVHRFAIDSCDTAFTLNLKSFNEALHAFKVVVMTGLREGALPMVQQEVGGRSYYGYGDAWEWAGFVRLDLADSAAISAIVNARNFGPGQDNDIGTAVLMVGSTPYIVRSCRVLEVNEAPELTRPGTVVRAVPLTVSSHLAPPAAPTRCDAARARGVASQVSNPGHGL